MKYFFLLVFSLSFNLSVIAAESSDDLSKIFKFPIDENVHITTQSVNDFKFHAKGFYCGNVRYDSAQNTWFEGLNCGNNRSDSWVPICWEETPIGKNSIPSYTPPVNLMIDGCEQENYVITNRQYIIKLTADCEYTTFNSKKLEKALSSFELLENIKAVKAKCEPTWTQYDSTGGLKKAR